jgi:hypothetical protein
MGRVRRIGVGLLALGGGLAGLLGSAACSATSDTVAATTTVTTAPPDTTTTTELPLTAGRQLSFYAPEVGDCFDRRRPDPKGPEVILKLDCNLPHTNEVVGVVEVPMKDFPGDEPLQSLGKSGCPKQFKAYVGMPYETSVYEMGYYAPTLANWGQGVRHTVGCYVHDPKTDAKLTGSVKGSNK